jgi:hypothetical protein
VFQIDANFAAQYGLPYELTCKREREEGKREEGKKRRVKRRREEEEEEEKRRREVNKRE